jgi:N-acetyl sugar amidotransferase
MNSVDYQICRDCVMDSTMPGTVFNADGVCNNCTEFDEKAAIHWKPNSDGAKRLAEILSRIKRLGSGKEYDCILGLSGGVDSSFLAFKVKEWGLRPLILHVDGGWNTELASANIRRVIEACDYDLVTEVVDWETMRDLQRAYLRAGVVNQDVPQDHVFIATLFHYARIHGIKSIISGHNFATESTPMRWQHPAMDRINLKAIHKAHGERPMKGYRTVSALEFFLLSPLLRGIKFYHPLNLMHYDKGEAIRFLEGKGWRNYPRKHGESIFTRLFQDYILPRKFGIDKRRAHLTSLIHSGLITRDEAMRRLQEPVFDELEIRREVAYFCRKLGISEEEFARLMSDPPRSHKDYSNWDAYLSALKPFKHAFIRLRG